jgi:glutaredoxin
MKQQCFVWSVWLTWLSVPVLAVLVWVFLGWPAAVVVVLAAVVAEVAYVRWFPNISTAMGYGSVADVPAEAAPAPAVRMQVTLYTASVCPFCPLVRKRLAALRQKLAFDLQELDVTFRPDLVATKKIRAVPVVEVDGRFWTGNATSAELVAFLTQAPSARNPTS